MSTRPGGHFRNPEQRRIHRETSGIINRHIVPLTADPDWFDASALFAGAANEVMTLAVGDLTNSQAPGYPVVPVVVVVDSAGDDWTAVSVVLTGINQFGQTIVETIAATNSSGTWTATALNAYFTITDVVTSVTGTTTSADTHVVGFVKTVGLGVRISAAAQVVMKNFDAAVEAGTVNVPYATYVIAGTPNAVRVLRLGIQSKAY